MANLFDLFDSVPVDEKTSSQFSGNHDVTTTAKFGTIEPLECLNYFPGDKFKFKYNTEVNFPPLLSPSYTRFKMHQYTFKCRKGLLFQNDEYSKFLLSARQAMNDVPIHPSIPFSNQNLYGSSVVGIRFHTTLPVYVTNFNGVCYLQLNDLPADTPCWNIFFKRMYDIYLESLDSGGDEPQEIFPLEEQIFYWNEFWKSLHFEILDGKDFSKGKTSHIQCNFHVGTADSLDNYVNISDPMHWNVVFADDLFHNGDKYTTFVQISDLSNDPDRFPAYVLPPILQPKGLMEKLGYPSNMLYIDDEFLKRLKNYLVYPTDSTSYMNEFPPYHSFADWISPALEVWNYPVYQEGALGGSSPLTYTRILNVNDGLRGVVSPAVFLQKVLMSFMFNGGAAGALVTYENSPVITSVPLKDLFPAEYILDNYSTEAKGVNASSKNMDLCRLTGYHLIWNEYFRDPNLTDELPLCKVYPTTHGIAAFTNVDAGSEMTSYEAYKDFLVTRLLDYNDVIPSDGSVKFYDGSKLFINDIRSYIECIYMLMYRFFEIPKKCMDKDYLTSALPNVSSVEVFAPVLPSLPDGGASVDKTSIPDYTPAFSSMLPDNLTFMSIDAFRTANVMQSFYINANLAGPRPVSFILMMFGVHSQDFRMEVPVLVDASQKYVQIQELTQQSETEQLPLGYQASKASLFKGSNDGFVDIDSEGDQGYVYTLYSIVPEMSICGGFDKMLLCDNVFQTTFFPHFAILGEEEIKKFEVQAVAPASIYLDTDPLPNFVHLNEPYGYQQRYANYKFWKSSVHGRFLTDMRFWHANRLMDSLNRNVVLSESFLEYDDPQRMFVDSEEENIFVFSVCQGEFIRELPVINPTKLL